MKLEQSFDVAAPIERVWQALVDVEHVAPCLPGAAVTGRNEDGSYNGSFTVKIGPTSASYAGRLEMDEIDEATRSAKMHASGSDKRGQGGARATIFSTLTEQPGGTHVEVITDYHITGRLARFGRGGMIEDISERLLREFAARLQASLVGGRESAGGPVPEAAVPADADGGRDGDAEELAEAATADAADLTERAPGGNGSQASAPPPPPPALAPAPPPPPALAPAPPLRPVPPPAPAEPIQGLSLVSGVLLDRIKRNPAPYLATLVVLLGLLRRRRRRRRRAAAVVVADD